MDAPLSETQANTVEKTAARSTADATIHTARTAAAGTTAAPIMIRSHALNRILLRLAAARSPANITVFDPAAEWTVRSEQLASKSRNTPYAGRTLRGKVRHTVLEGAAVVVAGVAQR